MSYIRYFIPLACEAKGYEYKGKPPAGRCILEAKERTGKLSLWVQDLKPETLYACYLLFPDGDRYAGTAICPLSVDARGKAELRVTFDAGDVNGSGCALSACVSVAVIATRAAELSAPLCGYRETAFSWRGGFYDMARQKTERAQQAIAEQAVPEPQVVEASAADFPPEDTSMAQTEDSVTEDADMTQAVFAEDSLTVTDEGPADVDEVLPDITTTETASPMTEDTPPVPDCENNPQVIAAESLTEMARLFRASLERMHNETKNEQALTETAEQTIAALFEHNIPMHPFRRQNRSVQWIRITPEDHVPLPHNLPHLYDDPFIQAAYRQYNHWILGVTTDAGKRMYVLGIPGIFEPEQRPKAVRLGFSQFKCCDDTRVARGEYGYWLMFING